MRPGLLFKNAAYGLGFGDPVLHVSLEPGKILTFLKGFFSNSAVFSFPFSMFNPVSPFLQTCLTAIRRVTLNRRV